MMAETRLSIWFWKGFRRGSGVLKDASKLLNLVEAFLIRAVNSIQYINNDNN